MTDPQIMELSHAIQSGILKGALPVILIVFIFGVLALFIKPIMKKLENKLKGKIGEKFISKKLRKLNKSKTSISRSQLSSNEKIKKQLDLDAEDYKHLDNLVLPSMGRTKVTQIDHIIVSNYGIFIIETKALQGWIFGDANQKNWTQVIYRYKNKFYNPLYQNIAHVKAVENLLKPGKLKAPVISLVVFTRADKIQVTGTDLVIHKRDLVNKIESYKNIIYSDTEQDEIFDILSGANIVDKITDKEHIKEVRKIQKNN